MIEHNRLIGGVTVRSRRCFVPAIHAVGRDPSDWISAPQKGTFGRHWLNPTTRVALIGIETVGEYAERAQVAVIA